MCVRERNTARRGRSAVPAIFVRTRACRAMRCDVLDVCAIPSLLLGLRADLAGLAGLAADVLARVLHALRLVGVGDAPAADVGGDLADDFLVDARDAELRRRLDREGDAGGRVDLDRVREAECEDELLALEHGTEARAADLEILVVARRHARDHVREQRARQAVQRTCLLRVVRARHGELLAVVALELHERVERATKLALRPLHHDVLPRDLHVDAAGDGDGHLSDPAHLLTYQTYARTSPPRPFFSASRPVMRPDDVDTIAMPSPPSTRGISVLRA